jgi:very-short-patch-repair endonuclease
MKVMRHLNEHFPDFIHDQPIQTSHCDCTHRRRIDFRMMIEGTLLAVEVDERQHRSYDEKDEEDRYNDLYMAFSGKWVFIRFNPDSYLKKGKRENPKIEKRFPALLQEITAQISRIKSGANINLVETIKLFYNS